MKTLTPFQLFADKLDDPRQQAKVLHPLNEILIQCLCALISGCESVVDIAEYGNQKLSFLRRLAPFKNGTASHDTICAVLRVLDPDTFQTEFASWVAGFSSMLDGKVVAIDGKTSRGSRAGGQIPLHLISAYCDDLRLVLGQRASDHKKNEIKDIPLLLEMLVLKGTIVTTDAMGCQREIAEKVLEKEADYVLALKGNQGTLHEDVKLYFEDPIIHEELATVTTVDGDKGRIENRVYSQSSNVDWLRERHPGWKGLNSIGRVVSTRELGKEVTTQTRYFISSLPVGDGTEIARAVRSHWGIENGLHHILDVTFRDDDSRVRKDHAPNNLATIKHMAMNLLNKAKPKHKKSLRVMRKIAGWNDDFLAELIKQ